MMSARALEDLGWQQLLAALAARCHTERGAEHAPALQPCAAVEQAKRRIDEILELRRLWDRGEPVSFGGVQDVRMALALAAKKSALGAEELIAVARSARAYHRIRMHIEERGADALPLLCERARRIADLSAMYEPIEESFDPDGRLRDDASPALGSLRRAVARLQQSLEARARELLDDPNIVAELQDRYWTQRDERFVLPVRASGRSKINGIVHGSSGSGQTVFVEPQALVELNNQLKLAECEVQDEERRIFAELTTHVTEHATEMQSAGEQVTELDVLCAAARLANDLGAHPPVISDDGRFDLRRARHPLMVLSGKECVPNDVVLEPGTVLVISGPNAGGKTVALKTLGLATLMLRHGLHIAAGEGSLLPWTERIFTAIGDSQSIESELSTFSAHLRLLCDCLEGADDRSLVLVDELCAATEPEQGAVLAQAVLEALADRSVPTLVTTHYEPLKALAARDTRFANAAVGFDVELLAPTFRLHLGVPGASAAIDVARRLRFPMAILDRAQALLGGEVRQVDALLRAVSEERERLHDERAALDEERAETARAYEEAMEALRSARDRDQRELDREHAAAVAALRDARLELDRVRGTLKTRRRVDELKSDGASIDAAARAISERTPGSSMASGKAPAPEQLREGLRVRVPKLGGRGEIVSLGDRGRVVVQLGSLKSTVDVSELVLDEDAPARASSRHKPRGAVSVVAAPILVEAPVRSPDCTLDLRGERVDAALSALDRFVDDGLLGGRAVIFVIHGHGTGALRGAVREHLQGHRCVSQVRAGEPSEGGDGVTVAWLDA